jgi:RNA polymerase sigma factor
MQDELIKQVQSDLSTQVQSELIKQVQIAKTDKKVLSVLLKNYQPFIKKCVAKIFSKNPLKADNLTDAMLAFAHSINTYNKENGAFIQYAATVIRNRLLDNARREAAAQKRFFSFFSSNIIIESFDREEDEKNLNVEIDEVNSEFFQWGFSWQKLLKNCPKQNRSRQICQSIAETVLASPELLGDMLAKRQLPASRLAEIFPPKALEKYRQYIVALIILSGGDYPYIYSFVPHFFNEEIL